MLTIYRQERNRECSNHNGTKHVAAIVAPHVTAIATTTAPSGTQREAVASARRIVVAAAARGRAVGRSGPQP